MNAILPYIQIVLSILLIALVLLQRSDASVGAALGGDSLGGTKFERRGAEKLMFNTTITVAGLFALSALATLLF